MFGGSTRRRWWVAVIVALTFTGAALVLVELPGSVAAGDPTGQILARLRVVAASVPKGAHVTQASYKEPLQDCPGKSGWSPAGADISFTWDGTRQELFGSIGRVLMRSGWRWNPTTRSPAQWAHLAYWNWTTTLFPSEPAIAELVPDGGSNWDLLAEAPAVPPRC